MQNILLVSLNFTALFCNLTQKKRKKKVVFRFNLCDESVILFFSWQRKRRDCKILWISKVWNWKTRMSFRYSSNNQGIQCVTRDSLPLFLFVFSSCALGWFAWFNCIYNESCSNLDFRDHKDKRTIQEIKNTEWLLISSFCATKQFMMILFIYFISEVIYGSRISECRGKCQLPLSNSTVKWMSFGLFKQLIE